MGSSLQYQKVTSCLSIPDSVINNEHKQQNNKKTGMKTAFYS